MVLQELTLKNFRVFSEIRINFIDGINIISGMNGQGKSSILEAIYYLALTRSFRTNHDNNVIQYDTSYFDISGTFYNSREKGIKVRLFYSETEGKNLFIRDKRITSFSEYIGNIPCIVLTLADTKLIYGGPAERRKFIDILLSQTSPIYLQELKKYKRVLYQRNTLLLTGNIKMIKDQLPSWNKQLIDSGSMIIMKRLSFLSFLNDHLSTCYFNLAHRTATINSTYISSIGALPDDSKDSDIHTSFYHSIDRHSDKEIEQGTTLYGPHRDDIVFNFNGKSFKEYCSQGEIKTLIIALKLMEWEYVKNHRQMDPILLLDDIFGELDQERIKKLLLLIRSVGQSFITTTLADKFEMTNNDKIFNLKDKTIYHA